MKDDVLKACLEFENRYSDIKTPEGAATNCWNYSDLFLKSYPKFKGVLIYLLGYRYILENRAERYRNDPNPNHDFYHVVCLLKENIIVDLTNKQLDSKGDAFKIMSMTEIHQEWLVLFGKNHQRETYLSMKSSLQEADKSWREKNHPYESEKHRQRNILKHTKKADVGFRKTLKSMYWHNIIFTGTESNNPHLKFINDLRHLKHFGG